MAAVKKEQKKHGRRNKNAGTPKGERGSVILVRGPRRDEINNLVQNHRAADSQSRWREYGEQTVARTEREDECGRDDNKRSGEEVVQQVAAGINVLDTHQVKVNALAYERGEHGEQDKKQGLPGSEMENRSCNCSSLAHMRTRKTRTIQLCRNGSRREMTSAWIGGGDDDTDGFLVETFEAAVALKIFQMAANCAVFDKGIELLLGDEFGGQQAFSAFAANLPPFAFGEGLAQKFEIGKRFHRVYAATFKLIAQEIEIEAGFEVMHAGFEKAFAVKTDP